MIQKSEMAQIMRFVSDRWTEIARNHGSSIMANLPDTFWMNSVGGRAGGGHWVTMLMYTESKEDAEAFKEVLLRWQSKGTKKNDLIQIGKHDR